MERKHRLADDDVDTPHTNKKPNHGILDADLSRCLTKLSITKSCIESISFLPATLTVLVLQENHLRHLPKTLPPQLQKFDCSKNHLTAFPLVTGDCLAYVDCSVNEIALLPSLGPNLQDLNCSNNCLTFLPAFGSKIKRILCYRNKLRRLPSLSEANHLQMLMCCHNPLTKLPAFPKSRASIRIVDCSHCELNTLPMLPMIYFLSLNNNPFREFPDLVPNQYHRFLQHAMVLRNEGDFITWWNDSLYWKHLPSFRSFLLDWRARARQKITMRVMSPSVLTSFILEHEAGIVYQEGMTADEIEAYEEENAKKFDAFLDNWGVSQLNWTF
jgi:hypothetical protein